MVAKFASELVSAYQQEGKHFKLVVLIPTSTFSITRQYSVIVSADWLDPMSPLEAITEIYNKIPKEDWPRIARITPIHTTDKFIQDFIENFQVDAAHPLVINNFLANNYLVEQGIIAVSGSTSANVASPSKI